MADKRKRVVIKLGTGILTKPTRDGLDTSQFRRLSAEIAELIRSGTETVMVTSGAVGAGLMQGRCSKSSVLGQRRGVGRIDAICHGGWVAAQGDTGRCVSREGRGRRLAGRRRPREGGWR